MQLTRHEECKMSSLYNGGYGAILYKKMYSRLYTVSLYTSCIRAEDAELHNPVY